MQTQVQPPFTPDRVVIPVGNIVVECVLPLPPSDAAIVVRYLVAYLVASLVGRHGFDIRRPQPYVGAIVRRVSEHLLAGGVTRQTEEAQISREFAKWSCRRSDPGVPLAVVAHALAFGAVLPGDAYAPGLVDVDERASGLIAALLGHPLEHKQCDTCDAARAGDWERVLDATSTPVFVLFDAYELARKGDWIGELRPLPRRPAVSILPRKLGGYDYGDEDL